MSCLAVLWERVEITKKARIALVYLRFNLFNFSAFIALHICPTLYLYNNNKFMFLLLLLLLFLYCRVLCKVFNSRRSWALAKVIAKALKRFHVNFFPLFSPSPFICAQVSIMATSLWLRLLQRLQQQQLQIQQRQQEQQLQQQLQLQSNAAGHWATKNDW